MINQINTIIAIAAISLSALVPFGTLVVNGQEFNTSDFEYTIHITDIIPYYTYSGISNVLTNHDTSFEDQSVIRLVVQDSNYYTVYNNDNSGNFIFSGIYENGA